MIALKINKILRAIICLEVFGGAKYVTYGLRIFVSSKLISVVVLSFMYFAYNFKENIHKAIITWAPTLGLSMFAIQYWHLLINRKRFYSLFTDMERTVNEST